MNTKHLIVTMKAPAFGASGHTSAQMRLVSVDPSRVRLYAGGVAAIGHTRAPDSAPWSPPV